MFPICRPQQSFRDFLLLNPLVFLNSCQKFWLREELCVPAPQTSDVQAACVCVCVFCLRVHERPCSLLESIMLLVDLPPPPIFCCPKTPPGCLWCHRGLSHHAANLLRISPSFCRPRSPEKNRAVAGGQSMGVKMLLCDCVVRPV